MRTSHVANANHREWCSRGTFIANTYVRETELIAHLRRYTTLQFCGKRISLTLKWISIVHVVQRSGRTRIVELLGIHETPTKTELIELIDVPVDFSTNLIALGINIGIGKRTTIIISLLGCQFVNLAQNVVCIAFTNTLISLRTILLHVLSIKRFSHQLRTVGVIAKEIGIFLVCLFIVNEKEQFIFYDRTAQRNTELIFFLTIVGVAICSVGLLVLLTDEVLVISVAINRTVERIGTRLRNSVNGTTRKTTLTNVERSNVHLDLFNGFHGNRIRSCLSTVVSTRSQTKHVVVHGSVNHERVITVVGSSKRHHARISHGQLWIQSCHVSNTVRDGRHIVDTLRIDTHGSTSLRGVDSTLALYNQFLQHFRILFQRTRNVQRFSKVQRDVGIRLGRITYIGNIHIIRTADTHTLYGISTVHVSNSTIDRTRRYVRCRNRCTDHTAISRHYLSVDTRRGYLRHH